MKKLVGAIGVLLVGAMLFVACTTSSQACSGKLDVSSERLQAAIDATLMNQGSMEKIDDADRQKYVENALRRTFSKDIVSPAVKRSCMTVGSGANRFSLHALVYEDAAAAAAIQRTVQQRKANTLKIEALTYYGFIPAGMTMLFFVADRQAYTENLSVLEEISKRYEEG